MKVRKNKHKILDRMANPSWHTESNKMWFIRDTTPCKSYSPWCPDCNARLFYKQLQRFPYSYEEWRVFELRQAAPEEAEFNRLEAQRNLMLEEMSRPPIDPEAQKLALKLILERNVND
jgi:hypothetical protein